MSENKMEEVAKLLGVEMGVPFKIKNLLNEFMIDEYGLYSLRTHIHNESILVDLLCGNYEIEQPILDDIEKRYLESIFRPFKNRVMYVEKIFRFGYEQIRYRVSLPVEEYGNELCELPSFDKGIMYKGMEYDKKYSIEELGLFEGDDE